MPCDDGFFPNRFPHGYGNRVGYCADQTIVDGDCLDFIGSYGARPPIELVRRTVHYVTFGPLKPGIRIINEKLDFGNDAILIRRLRDQGDWGRWVQNENRIVFGS